MVVQPEIGRCETEHNSGHTTALYGEFTAAEITSTKPEPVTISSWITEGPMGSHPSGRSIGS